MPLFISVVHLKPWKMLVSGSVCWKNYLQKLCIH